MLRSAPPSSRAGSQGVAPTLRRSQRQVVVRQYRVSGLVQRPLCTGGNYAQMRSVRVPWPRICAACTSTWPTRLRHSFRAHESRVAACGLHVLWSLATAVPGRDWWQLRSTRSNASIREACRLFKAGEQSRDELGHRLSHEINSRWRWAARGLLVPKTMQRSRNTLRAACPGGVVRRRLGSAHSHDLRIGVAM